MHDEILDELGVRADKDNSLSLAFPYGEIEVTDFSSILFVKARDGHAHDVL